MIFVLVLAIVGAMVLALWLVALVDVVRTPDGYSVGTQLGWFVVLLLFGPLGLLLFVGLAKRRESSMLRWARSGAVAAGSIGGVVGLVVGLRVNPRTGWFAVFEIGAPAALVGALVGLAAAAMTGHRASVAP